MELERGIALDTSLITRKAVELVIMKEFTCERHSDSLACPQMHDTYQRSKYGSRQPDLLRSQNEAGGEPRGDDVRQALLRPFAAAGLRSLNMLFLYTPADHYSFRA